MKGSERNQPCPCGSGFKAKHCPGPHLADIEAAYREDSEREIALRIARNPRRSRDRLSVLALAALAVQPPVLP